MIKWQMLGSMADPRWLMLPSLVINNAIMTLLLLLEIILLLANLLIS